MFVFVMSASETPGASVVVVDEYSWSFSSPAPAVLLWMRWEAIWDRRGCRGDCGIRREILFRKSMEPVGSPWVKGNCIQLSTDQARDTHERMKCEAADGQVDADGPVTQQPKIP